jgi:AcrR family transcriptional regulator
VAGRQARKSIPQRASGPALWASVGARVRDRERKRDAVIMTAARAFRERGYHNTSLDDIASELNVTKPTVYHYVENKEQLLFECFRAGLKLIMDGIEEQRESTTTGQERLVQAENQDLSPTMSRKVKLLKSEIDQGLRSLIRAGVDDGSIRACDEKMTAFALAGALNWIAHWYRSDDKLAASEIAQRFIELFELGLRPR